nr:hypothetical protein BgiMline_007717 [Biomphalaria glabrata]
MPAWAEATHFLPPSLFRILLRNNYLPCVPLFVNLYIGTSSLFSSLLNRTIVCQEEVIAQCQSNKKWRTLHLTSSQNSLLSRREEFQNNCHSEIMCADIGQCRIYMEKIAEAMEQDQVFEACGYLKANIQCLRLAVADCNREDSFDPVMLDNYTLTLKDSENKWQKDCDNVYIVQGSYVTGSHVYNMCTETSWSWCLVFVSLLVAGTFLECSLTFNKFFLVLS